MPLTNQRVNFMSNPITSCSFSCQRLNPQVYEYTTNFHDKDNAIVSKRIVEFIAKCGPTGTGNLVDVYSQNGRCFSNPKEILTDKEHHLFGHRDVDALKRAGKKLRLTSEDRTVLVLDLKDPQGEYLDVDNIQTSEKIVHECLRSPEKPSNKRVRQAHEVFHTTLPTDYIFNEGSLKTHLIKQLPSDNERKFFLNDQTLPPQHCLVSRHVSRALFSRRPHPCRPKICVSISKF